MKTHINPPGYPVHPFYSQAVEVKSPERTLYVAGQYGIGADGNSPADVERQTQNSLANMVAVLAAAGMTAADVVKYTIFLTDPADMDAFIAAASESLPQPPPATTLVIVKALAAPQMRIEIEAVAAR
jgi:enamine deaminase RidA (YjgF/YER057c/UK114 family)